MNLPKFKIVYFFLAMYAYSFYTFKNLVIELLTKINKPNQSTLNGIIFFISFFINVFITFLTDKFKIHKQTLLTSLILSFITFQFMLINQNKKLFYFLYFTYSCMNQVLSPIVDMFIYSSKLDYSKIRVFDSYGYIVSTCISEVGYNILQVNQDKGLLFLKIFNLVTFFGLITVFCLFLNEKQINTQQIKKSSSNFQPIRFVFLLFIVLLIGINRTSMSNFLSDYYKNFLQLNKDNSKIKLSICSSFGVLGEIIVFNFSLTNLIGLFYPLFFGTFFQALRFLFYFMLKPTNSFLFVKVCGIETMKGLTFSMVHSSCTALSKLYGGKYESMAQFIYNGTYVALGNLCSGIFMSNTLNHGNDFSHFFKTNAIVCGISLFLIVLMKLIFVRGWHFTKKEV
ncbi:nucleoside transporter [Tubulinosema ratisbonensis]|uniref:Nucleoside transporter n=1 Tax=Tubulinosema ratisbonensis TaxID=291195 RepID=A0A437APE2_9MICR|nr:nucleoside transporter [Tubulinosema ratisbonensis]